MLSVAKHLMNSAGMDLLQNNIPAIFFTKFILQKVLGKLNLEVQL